MRKISWKKMGIVLGMCVTLAGVAACQNETSGEGEQTDLKTIKIGASADMETTLACLKEPLEELGYQMEETYFEDYVMPNQALAEGSIQCNFYQNIPYVEEYNANEGTDLVFVDPPLLPVPYAICSNEISSLDELKEGMTISIPNAPSNRERVLKILDNVGIITLADKPQDTYYTQADIVENPYKCEIQELEGMSLSSSINDVTMVCLPKQSFYEFNGDMSKVIYTDNDDYYACGIVINSGDEDADWLKALMEAGQSEEYEKAVVELYDGVIEFD